MKLFDKTLAALKDAHKQDPNTDYENGKPVPAEWLYTQRIANFIETIYPEASEELRLAGYCQHLYRWEIKRKTYPEGKMGYYQWRNFLGDYQAKKTVEILKSCGYDSAFTDRVVAILKKLNIYSVEEAQMLEDVVCLVFLKYYMESFTKGKSEKHLVQIVQKTWGKMSEKGHSEALKLDLPTQTKEIVSKALS